MNQLTPLLVEMVWPVTLVVILWAFRKRVKSILCALEKRIRRGDPFKVPGISVGRGLEASVTDLTSSTSRATSFGISPGAESPDVAQTVLRGVWLEIRLNKEVANSILGDLNSLLHGEGLIPLRRLSEKATAGFIQRPLVPLDDPTLNLCWIYLQEITMFNRLVDSIDDPGAPSDYTRARITQALPFRERLEKSGTELLAAISERPRPAEH